MGDEGTGTRGRPSKEQTDTGARSPRDQDGHRGSSGFHRDRHDPKHRHVHRGLSGEEKVTTKRRINTRSRLTSATAAQRSTSVTVGGRGVAVLSDSASLTVAVLRIGAVAVALVLLVGALGAGGLGPLAV